MLNTPSVRCYASEKISQWNDCMTKDLQDSNSQVAVEMWRYDPRKLSKEKWSMDFLWHYRSGKMQMNG